MVKRSRSNRARRTEALSETWRARRRYPRRAGRRHRAIGRASRSFCRSLCRATGVRARARRAARAGSGREGRVIELRWPQGRAASRARSAGHFGTCGGCAAASRRRRLPGESKLGALAGSADAGSGHRPWLSSRRCVSLLDATGAPAAPGSDARRGPRDPARRRPWSGSASAFQPPALGRSRAKCAVLEPAFFALVTPLAPHRAGELLAPLGGDGRR